MGEQLESRPTPVRHPSPSRDDGAAGPPTAPPVTSPSPGPAPAPAPGPAPGRSRRGDGADGESPPAFRRRPARTGRRLPWLILGALVLAAAMSLLWWRALPERVPGTPVARREVARTLVLTGRVRPPARPRIGTSIGGSVREVLVREGDHVDRGQLLLRIDDAQAAAALAQARAALATAAARSRSSVEQAGLTARSTARDAGRARALFAQGAISRRDLEEAERAAAAAAAELDAASARVGPGSPATLAEVERARAAVSSAVAQLALTRVSSPAAATVLTRDVEPGDAVLPGRPLIELALDGPTELVAYAREENLAELRTGAAAVASADAFPDRTFAARVSWLAPRVDPTQGTVEVRLAVPEPPSYLRADMTVSINVEVERHADALVVPREAVGDIGSGAPWVMVERDGRSVRRPVRIGVRGDSDVEVVSGLTATDRVLPVGTSPGSRVSVTAPASRDPDAPAAPGR